MVNFYNTVGICQYRNHSKNRGVYWEKSTQRAPPVLRKNNTYLLEKVNTYLLEKLNSQMKKGETTWKITDSRSPQSRATTA